MPLSDYTLSSVERHAWYSALTCSKAPLVFPSRGSGAPRQRPQPHDRLQFWLRVVLQLTSFQSVWALVFFILSLTARRSLVGAVLNLPYAGAALLGIFGALKLSYAFVGTALLSSMAVDIMFVAFSVWAYYDTGEAIILALHLPSIAVDFFVTLSCVPLVLQLYRAEHQATFPTVPTSAADIERVSGGAPTAAPGPPPAAAEPPPGQPQQPIAAQQPRARLTEQNSEDDDPLATVPEFRCPITLLVMVDPVIAADGHSYERTALESWLRLHRTSPLTGAPLDHMHIVPNHRLRSLIETARQNTHTTTDAPVPAPA